jgi:hypothetical protein
MRVPRDEDFIATRPSDGATQSAADRICDFCAETIDHGTDFHVGLLTPYEAAALLDVDDPALVPTWTQLADGTVRLDICLTCWSLVDDASLG